MRLTPPEIKAIHQIISTYVKNYELYLHGSRIDDEAKGGDIDLFLISPHEVFKQLLSKKHYLSSELIQACNKQKIDLTIINTSNIAAHSFFNNSHKVKI